MDYSQKQNQVVNQIEEKHMEDNINTSDILAYRGLGGLGGYGYGGHGNGNLSQDGSVVNNNVERNAIEITTQAQSTRNVIRDNDNNNKFVALTATINNNQMQTQRDLADARAEAAKCCCENKLLIVEENNATRTLLLEQKIQSQDATINTQQASNNQSQILAAMNAQTQLLAELCSKKH